ncbi:DsbA family oxidoreductase [Hydrogenophaga sp. OTU3427]|uniref:DsbA family oxidoreductase n=1 Tax=Hydrogenophaga sp. OTU3427 TaxID=3043856 RepID=UPI00313E8547
MAPALAIDVWFDLICPWCLIGRHQLNAALAQWRQAAPDVPVTLRWHPVQLIPQVPPQGWAFQSFYEQRLGSAAAVAARQAQVRQAAQAAGARVDFARIRTFPNTAAAHRLLGLAARQLGEAGFDNVLRDLFTAYFERGLDIGQPLTLMALAEQHGIPTTDLADTLANTDPLPKVDVPGVPFFVFNQRVALSGAQPPEVLLAAMRQATHDAPVVTP